MEYKEYRYDGKRTMDILKQVSGGKTQIEMSDELDISQSAISKLSKDIPSVDTLIKISLKYGISVDELLGLEPQKESSPTLQNIMSLVDNLFIHKHISFDHVSRREIVDDNPVSGYPDFDDVSVPALIPDSKYLQKALEDYMQLSMCVSDNISLNRKIIELWIKSLLNMSLDDLSEYEDLPLL